MSDEAKPAIVLTIEDARALVHGKLSELPHETYLGPRSNEIRLQVSPEKVIVLSVSLGSF